MSFADRAEAGRVLASKLTKYKGCSDALILALPRGGIPVAFEVAAALGLPVDVFVVRKLGVPGQEELAMGAIATGDVQVINYGVVQELRIGPATIEAVAQKEREELQRRERLYRGERSPRTIQGKTIILIDDGIATGSTMRAAIAALRQIGPTNIIVAAPVASADTCRELSAEADEVICAETPETFFAISQFYRKFDQTTDEEVRDLLARGA
jgi:Predicted phosphoribosyltransferases